jgi:hypothetical protein
MSKQLLLIGMVLGIVFVTGCVILQPPQEDIGAEEYAVYSALLSTHVTNQIKLVVVYDHTSSESLSQDDLSKTLKYVSQNMPEVEQAVIDDYQAKNRRTHQLSNRFELSVDYVLISEEEFNDIFEKGTGWEDFYVRYPNSTGIIHLSRVGFNHEMNQALIYAGHQAYWLAGRGYYVLLTKEDGTWVINSSVVVWIS